MLWVLGIIKFIFSALGIFSTALFLNSIVSSIVSSFNMFPDKNDEDDANKAAGLRILLAIAMSISWSVIMIL